MMGFNQIQHHWSSHERDAMAYWPIRPSCQSRRPRAGVRGYLANRLPAFTLKETVRNKRCKGEAINELEQGRPDLLL
jgi:hypothetical protein